jgi:hypothetical protein
MPSLQRLTRRTAFALASAGLVAASACSSDPDGQEDTATAQSAFVARVKTCGPIEQLDCTATEIDPGEGPGGSTLVSQGSCTCDSLTTAANPPACGSGATAVPTELGGLGCTLGVVLTDDGSPDVSTIWACPAFQPSGAPTPVPATIGPLPLCHDVARTSDDGGLTICQGVVSGSTLPGDNPFAICVGSTLSPSWILVQQFVGTLRQSTMPCPGGCNPPDLPP